MKKVISVVEPVQRSDAVLGFMQKNKIEGKTDQEIDALIENAVKLKDGTILGEGDKFKKWCGENGRELPSEALVSFMNRDPFNAGAEIKKNIPNDIATWRNWCTYHSGKGRRNV